MNGPKKIKEKDPLVWAMEHDKKIKEKDPIVWALDNDQVNNVLIMAAENNIKVQGNEPLVWAVENNQRTLEEDLLICTIKNKTRIDGKDPVIWADEHGCKFNPDRVLNILTNGNEESIASLIKKGANVNRALMRMVLWEMTEGVNLLIANGADPYVQEKNGKTIIENHPEFFSKEVLTKIYDKAKEKGNKSTIENLKKYYSRNEGDPLYAVFEQEKLVENNQLIKGKKDTSIATERKNTIDDSSAKNKAEQQSKEVISTLKSAFIGKIDSKSDVIVANIANPKVIGH